VWYGNDDFTPMNKVTGGLIPAGTWHDVMLWAEQPQVATALPGVPMEQRYLQYAAENPAPPLEDIPDMSADDTIADASAETPAEQPEVETPDTGKSAKVITSDPSVRITKPPKRQKTAPAPTEEDVAIVRPRESDDPVVNVLKDMFSIFSDDDNPGKAKRKKKKKDATLVLPNTNTKKKRKSNDSFLHNLFD
jgi:hypothetical protein